MPIKKAVIACGGWSTRFLPAVKVYAKPLVPILDKPQIHWLLEGLVSAGITDVCIIHRHGENSIQRYFKPDLELFDQLSATNKLDRIQGLLDITKKVSFKFLPQPRHLPYGNGTPILAAKSFIGSDDFVYLFGDDLTIEDTPGAHLKKMISLFESQKADCVAAVQQVPWEEVHRYGTVEFDKQEKNRIKGVFEKVPREQAPSNFSQVSPYILTNQYIKLLQNQSTGKGNELWLADTNHHVAQIGKVLAYDLMGAWITTGDPVNWLKANLTMAFKNPEMKPEITSFLRTIE